MHITVLLQGLLAAAVRLLQSDLHQKRWAGCRHTHGATEACVQLAAEHDLRPEDVAALHVETYEIAKVLVDRPVTAEPTAIACTLSLP